MYSTLLSRNRVDQPFPCGQPADMSLMTVPPKIGVIAWRLQGGNDVHIFPAQRANAPVDFSQLELAALGAQFAPAALEFVVLRGLFGRTCEVIEDGAQRNGRARPFGEWSELSERPGEDDRTTDQEHEAEQPAQVPVQLDVPRVEFDGVVDVELRFVVGALAAHGLSPLLRFLAGWRCRRVAMRWHLGSEVFRLNDHEGSLLVFWVLGSAPILACEPSSFYGRSAA